MAGDDLKEGCGCLLTVIAIFLFMVLWQVTPEMVTFLETWFKAHS